MGKTWKRRKGDGEKVNNDEVSNRLEEQRSGVRDGRVCKKGEKERTETERHESKRKERGKV